MKTKKSGLVIRKWIKLQLLASVAILLRLNPASCQRVPTSHVVGGEATMWAVPADPNFYQTWAYSQQFVVGNKLVFHIGHNTTRSYASQHGVVQFPDDKAFLDCDPSGAMKLVEESETSQTVVVDLPSSGMFYYGCPKHEYCTRGQKFFIKVWPASR